MATPMEYDTLREIFSSAGAALHRLKVTYGVVIEKYVKDKEKFNAVWINEVHKKDLEQIDYKTTALHLKAAAKNWMDDIDYQAATQKMNDAAKPWSDLAEELWQESQEIV